jgi:3-hydroxymyristoyl/3-hydroxydecanoyl-(acyl carrier protein) dehydratase
MDAAEACRTGVILDRTGIERLMPHHPAWVFVDRVLECDPPTFIRTQTCFRADAPFVAAHFRGGPSIVPGVILLEYISQSAYLLGRLADGVHAGCEEAAIKLLARCTVTFVSVAAGDDVLDADVRLADRVGDIAVYEGSVRCASRMVCRAKIFAAPRSVDTPLTRGERDVAGTAYSV